MPLIGQLVPVDTVEKRLMSCANANDRTLVCESGRNGSPRHWIGSLFICLVIPKDFGYPLCLVIEQNMLTVHSPNLHQLAQ